MSKWSAVFAPIHHVGVVVVAWCRGLSEFGAAVSWLPYAEPKASPGVTQDCDAYVWDGLSALEVWLAARAE